MGAHLGHGVERRLQFQPACPLAKTTDLTLRFCKFWRNRKYTRPKQYMGDSQRLAMNETCASLANPLLFPLWAHLKNIY